MNFREEEDQVHQAVEIQQISQHPAVGLEISSNNINSSSHNNSSMDNNSSMELITNNSNNITETGKTAQITTRIGESWMKWNLLHFCFLSHIIRKFYLIILTIDISLPMIFILTILNQISSFIVNPDISFIYKLKIFY